MCIRDSINSTVRGSKKGDNKKQGGKANKKEDAKRSQSPIITHRLVTRKIYTKELGEVNILVDPNDNDDLVSKRIRESKQSLIRHLRELEAAQKSKKSSSSMGKGVSTLDFI
eukprot:TRINITY_DN7988_c0_g1_i1.p3 TRINITY_DN7988_c0_g1~~TRINITY_DN7988_c0_g1_i1.p3  ORF type:complete len:112 (+),score=24.23 TRINITY_DN7988_c0_g1_i1:64-399(+)